MFGERDFVRLTHPSWFLKKGGVIQDSTRLEMRQVLSMAGKEGEN